MLVAAKTAYEARVGQPLAHTIHQRQAQKEEIAKYRAEVDHWQAIVTREKNGGRNPAIRIAFGQARG